MFYIGDALVDPASRQVTRGHHRQRLSPKATRVLETLAAAPGQVLRREALLDAVWPEVTVGEEVLTHAIAELRKALGDDFREPRHIETVHKSGYRLLSPVRRDDDLAEAMRGLDISAALDGETPDLPGRSTPGDAAFDLEDYALYLTACDLFDRGGRSNVHAAAELFSRLIEDRPHYAPGYAGLAKALTFIDLYFGPQLDCLARALDSSETALRLDPGSAEAHAAHGLALARAGQVGRARRSFKSAIRLQPDSDAIQLLLGHAGFAWGDHGLSAVMLEQAARRRADDYHSLALAAKARRGLGDEAGARANAAKAKARVEVHLLAFPDDFRALCGQARILIELGERAEGLDLIGRLLRHRDPMNYYFASSLAFADEVPLALDRLEETADDGWRNAALLHCDPDLDVLRREPRFRRLETALGAG